MTNGLVQAILEKNGQMAKKFCQTTGERRDYRRQHPTEVIAMQCMDGRVSITDACSLPCGLITSHRSIGGRFRLSWPLLRNEIGALERYAYKKRRSVLLIATYHWSEGDTHRGCAGFKYNTSAGKADAAYFNSQVEHCFEGRIRTVLVGLETDTDALVVHGEGDRVLDMRNEPADVSVLALQEKLAHILPNLPLQLRIDLAGLLEGNVRHIAAIKKEMRPLDSYKHGEQVLALGGGFDWLDDPNFALKIGACDPVLTKPILTAAQIIRENWQEGRIEQGGVLLVSTPYRFAEDRKGAMVQSKGLAALALSTITEQMPDMVDFFTPLVGVVDMETRQFEQNGH